MKQIEYEGDKSRVYSDQGRGETMADIMQRRFSRRAALAGATATGAVVTLGIPAAAQTPVASPMATPGATPVGGGPALALEGLALQRSSALILLNAHYEDLPFRLPATARGNGASWRVLVDTGTGEIEPQRPPVAPESEIRLAHHTLMAFAAEAA